MFRAKNIWAFVPRVRPLHVLVTPLSTASSLIFVVIELKEMCADVLEICVDLKMMIIMNKVSIVLSDEVLARMTFSFGFSFAKCTKSPKRRADIKRNRYGLSSFIIFCAAYYVRIKLNI